MIADRVPSILTDFAGLVMDITPDSSASDEQLVYLSLDNLSRHDDSKHNDMLVELKACLVEVLEGTLTDADLQALWQATNAQIKFRDGPHTRNFLMTAQRLLNEYIRTGGGSARDMWALYPIGRRSPDQT